MKKTGKYYRGSIALTEREHGQFVKTGLGIKKIFKAMLDALVPVSDDDQGDGINKSSIMLNIPEQIPQAHKVFSEVTTLGEEEI